MSSRRNNAGGKKPKAKAKQPKGGLPVGQLPKDVVHNLEIPSCQLLEDLTREFLLTFEGEESPSTAAGTQRPTNLLCRMMRDHLLEQRRQQLAALSPEGAVPSTPGKKKKKKKKKKGKAGAAPAAGTTGGDDNQGSKTQETDETDSTAALSSTVSQDSQSVSQSFSKDESKNEVTAPPEAEVGPAPSTPPRPSSHVSSATTSTDEHQPPRPNIDLVESYLDRLLASKNYLAAEADETNNALSSKANKNNAAPSPVPAVDAPPRELDAFIQYLNEKCNATAANPKGQQQQQQHLLSISHQELEVASKSIECKHCREALVKYLGKKDAQPVVLPSISFGKKNSQRNSHNHNGLAIPVRHQPPAPPHANLDFDYVALEEGMNPAGTLMEAKADLAGIPYFHPRLASANQTTNSSGGGNNQGNKKQVKAAPKWGPSEETDQNQHDWIFVSSMSSPTTPADSAVTADNTSTNKTSKDEIIASEKLDVDSQRVSFTVQDLEHIVRDVLIPMALPPDTLVGTYVRLTQDEQQTVIRDATRLTQSTEQEISHVTNEANRYLGRVNLLRKSDNQGQNMNLDVGDYRDLNSAIHKCFREVVVDIVWDRILWYHHEVHTPPAWESPIAYMIDCCTEAILGVMSTVEEFEGSLSELVNTQGGLPALFTSLPARTAFQTMMSTKIRIMLNLLQKIGKATEAPDDAWLVDKNASSNGPSGHEFQGISGVMLPFSVKWFAEHAMLRAVGYHKRADRAEAARKGSLASSNGKANKTEGQSATLGDQLDDDDDGFVSMEKLDTLEKRLVKDFLEFGFSAFKARPEEMWEETNLRCEVLLSRLGEVCDEIFLSYIDAEKRGVPGTDTDLRIKCQLLVTDVQQQKVKQTQQELLEGQSHESVQKQRRTVANMTVASLRLLRKLRVCLSTNASYLMPLSLIACLPRGSVPGGFDMYAFDAFDGHYESLIAGGVYANRKGDCTVAVGGQRRFFGMLLALFYRKLSDLCSEWQAELAEKELLTTMSEELAGLEESAATNGDVSGNQKDIPVSQNGDSNTISSNASKANKKPKKKKDKKGPGSSSKASEAEPTKEGQEEPIENQSIAAPPPGFLNSSSGEAEGTNGHEESQDDKAAVPDKKKKVADIAADSTTATTGNASPAVLESKPTERDEVQVPANWEEDTRTEITDFAVSTSDVDAKFGVAENSGALQPAESFLVGRLTSLLKTSKKNRKGKGASGPVIIII